jgi:hypothetical protein
MQTEKFWEQFTRTGSIADYLQYAAEKGRTSATDSEGRCTDAKTGW